MVDASLPALTHLYANPSGGCNLRCTHCWVSPVARDEPFSCREPLPGELSPARWSAIVSEAIELGLGTLKITGGEPLLRSDFAEIWLGIADTGVDMSIETNGSVQPPGLWEAWAARSPSWVSVSLDGAREEVHDSFRGVQGAWKKALGFCGELLARGICFEIVTCVGTPDVTQVREIAKLASDLGASVLKVNLIQPLGRGKANSIARHPVEGIVEFIQVLDGMLLPHVRIGAPPAFISAARLVDMPRCPVANLIGILPDGGVSLCGIGLTRTDMVVGSVLRPGALQGIWQEAGLFLELRKALAGPRPQPCGGCMFRRSCQGHCVVENYVAAGDFAAPFWLCESAWKNGLFPKSRRIDGEVDTPG
jgi:SynChlorMet cassette radical SAM/SPASM protein ScmF